MKKFLNVKQTIESDESKVMIFSPHEDDETIACAGVIRRCINNSNTTKLVMVTTGDYGDPKIRIQKTINSMALLGLSKENIVYLGYGDHDVLGPAYLSKDDPEKIFSGTYGNQTYGFPEIGIVDYHYSKYGIHAEYNRENIFNDILDVIEDNLPEDIYMPSPMENHPDHSVTGIFVISAILRLKERLDYSPIIHEYMVYKEGLPQNNLNALQSVLNIESHMDRTSPYSWCSRESIPVPDEMYASIESGNNLKSKAFDVYEDDAAYWRRFIKSNEVFWKKQMSNLAYNATVEASSENTDTGQYCTNVIDGIILGYPYGNSLFTFYDKEWTTLGEKSGAWIQLSWPTLIEANRIILYDRPNFDDHIIRGTLTFSDGSEIPVGSLPNNGSQYIVDFKAKTFDWVKLTVDRAEGYNIGISEFEVYYLSY